MLRLLYSIFVAVVLVASQATLADSGADRMDQIVRSVANDGRFMGAVLVARGDKVILNKGYGDANLEWHVANSPTTKYRLGSLTKQFTAASILLLEEKGQLSIDDLVSKYVENAPPAWAKIKLFHLLTHTSGIPNFTAFPDYALNKAMPATPSALIERFRTKPLDFEPGAQWRYSNSGYVVLGYVIEKVSGQSYGDFVQRNIFQRLHMDHSGYDSNSAIISDRASGYVPDNGGVKNSTYIDMSIPFAAGGLYSTTEDLLKWEHGLFGGEVISQKSLEKMTTPYQSDYGFGLFIRDAAGDRIIDHSGGIDGFNTKLRYYPKDKTVVVVLGNINGDGAEDIGRYLGEASHGRIVKLPSERKSISLPSVALHEYVGDYELNANVKIAITLEGEELKEQLTGQSAVPVFAESKDNFFLKAVDAQITFRRNGVGEIDALILHQNGWEQVAKRSAAAH